MSCPFVSTSINQTANTIDQSEYIQNKKTILTMFGTPQPNSQYVMLSKCANKFNGSTINNNVASRNTSNTTLNQTDYINNKKYIVTMLGKTTSAVKPRLGNLYIQSVGCKL
jgi:hypothetical protein